MDGPERPVSGMRGVGQHFSALKGLQRVFWPSEGHLCGLSGGVWGRIHAERVGEELERLGLRQGLGDDLGLIGARRWGRSRWAGWPQADGIGRDGCEGGSLGFWVEGRAAAGPSSAGPGTGAGTPPWTLPGNYGWL